MENIKRIFFSRGIFELNEFNRKIIDLAPMSIMIVNRNGNILFVNQYFKTISSEKNPLLKSIFDAKFFTDVGLAENYRKLLETGKAFKKDNCPSANNTKYLNIAAVPLLDKNGNVGGALSMAVDVTEVVKARAELKQFNALLFKKIEERTRELREAKEKLEETLDLKLRFISDASHELRTPLAIAKLNLELSKDQISNKDAAAALDAVDNEINKVSDILSDIAFFTAIDDKASQKINFEKVDLTKLLNSICERLKVLADEKDIDLIFKKPKQNFMLAGDRTKLEKLFLNIIGNSIKYGKESGWVKILIDPDKKNKSIKIIIADDGIGISKKDLPHIFDRFYRAKHSKSRGDGGFGLGLSICKWIIDQHKGQIDVKSVFDKGTVFTITLPLT